MTEITRPDWALWQQSGAARIWYAVLLTMNIEPSVNERKILKSKFPDEYKDYQRRLSIAKRCAGIELKVHEKHLNAGKGVKNQYVGLSHFLEFAISKGWGKVEPMRDALQVASGKLSPDSGEEIDKRVEKNYLIIIDALLSEIFPDYAPKKTTESANMLRDWINDKNASSDRTYKIPEVQTLEKYMRKIVKARKSYA
ncbi:hypothetical protein [Collimonas fungivorans]|uniref:hypothetical protein n=1 Tax=Collimonas fungivorans TaxID=158899 RepID=UPI0012370875|nr:hypothetical protein [Collimonas fungivorans]